MTDVINKAKLNNLADDIWKSAERLRGKFRAYEYQSVIMPMIVLRRLECVLLAWRDAKAAEIRKSRKDIKPAELEKLVKSLEKAPNQAPFYNTSPWTMAKIYENDHTRLDDHFRAWINGFSKNVEDIIDHFNFRATIGLMVKYNRLAPILNQYKDREFGPDKLSNLEMGYIYEELLRRFSEQSGEEAGEHFTPREVIRLMVELLDIPMPKRSLSLYDPACGTGGMLSVAKEHLLERAKNAKERADVDKYVAENGQELQPGNYAIACSDLLIKGDKQARITLGNSLIPHSPSSKEPGDQFPEAKFSFDFMLSNPPFGVTWGGKDGYEAEARRLQKTRYKAGMPRTTDGALLFLQTMLAKMKPTKDGGSRIAIVFNGSPLSNGDCGSGESEIRRWILENDWLDAIVMLPDQLFYNTGIHTYIWLLRNEKPKSHKGRVMLIDARKQFEKEPKSFGNKRNRITDANREWIETRYREGWADGYADDNVKLFATTDFAFHKVEVVFWQTGADDKPAIIVEPYEKAFTAANLKKEQEFHASDLSFDITVDTGDGEEVRTLDLAPDDSAARKLKTLLADVGGLAAVKSVKWTHRNYVKDDEYIAFEAGGDPAKYIPTFLEREIAKPIIRWKDSEQLGYEILPNKYFYRYQPPTPADELLKQFWKLEQQAEALLKGLAA